MPITNTELSLGIKETPKILLDISSYLFSLTDSLNKYNFVFLKAENEAGKSVICSELCRRFEDNCFSIFFSKFNRSEYNLDYVYENFIPQIENYFDVSNTISDNPSTELNSYTAIFKKLQNKLRRTKKETFYFVIDGLEHCSDIRFISEFFDLMSFDVPNFKFVLSKGANEDLLQNPVFNKLGYDQITKIGFGISEIRKYFVGVVDDEESIVEIHSITKGLPSRLEILKRFLEKNASLSLKDSKSFEQFLEEDIDQFIESYKLTNLESEMLISLISFSDNLFSLDDLEVAIEKKEENFMNLIMDGNPYLNLNEKKQVSFSSSLYKEAFKRRFNSKKSKAEELELKIFYKQPQIEYKIKLIEKLFENKNHREIIKQFESNFLTVLVNTTQNTKIINSIIQKVCNSAVYLEKYTELFNYSLQGSIINELENENEYEDIITSLIAINELDQAILLTDLQISKVTKIYLYVKIAVKQKEKRGIVEEVLIEKIDSIFNELELDDFGEKIYEIISDLINISSKYALEILNKNSSNSSNRNNINNLLLTRLSLATLSSTQVDENIKEEKFTEIFERIGENKTKTVSTALRIFVGKYSFDKLLVEVDNYDDIKDRIKLLRYWLENTTDFTNIDIIINKTIDEIIRSESDDFFNLEVFSEISKNLFKITNTDKKENLIQRFKELSPSIVDSGLFISKTKFQLNIFNALYNDRYNDENAKCILNQILEEVSNYPDQLIKCECVAIVFEYISPKLNFLGQIKTKVRSLFFENFKILLPEISDTFNAIRNILKSAAIVGFEFSEEIIKQLNTSINRDKSRFFIIEEYLDNEVLKINLDALIAFTEKFEEKHFINSTGQIILERFSKKEKDSLNDFYLGRLNMVYNLIKTHDISRFSKIYLELLLVIIYQRNNHKKYSTLINTKKQIILKGVRAFEETSKKSELCYFLSSIISKTDSIFAKQLFKETNQDHVFNYIKIKLNMIAISNFEALIKLNSSGIEKKFLELISNIEKVTEKEDKLELLTYLGFVCYINNQKELSEKNYQSVFNLLNELLNHQPPYLFTKVLSFIYLFNQGFVRDLDSKLPYLIKQQLYRDLCNFYLFKNSPYEIYDNEQINFDCTYSDIELSLNVLQGMSYDVYIYDIIERMSKLCEAKNIRLQQLQIDNIKSKVHKIIEERFPDPLNIQHLGYKLASKIRFQKYSKKFIYQEVLNEINKIPNVSDRILVKSILIDEVNAFKKFDQKNELFDQILEDLSTIKNNYEYIIRVNDISESMLKVKKDVWKTILDKAFNLSNNFEDDYNKVKYQRLLIATLFKLDEDLAKYFVEKGDTSLKNDVNKFIKKHYNSLLEINSVDKLDLSNSENIEKNNFIKGIIENIKAVNSNRIRARRIPEMKECLSISSKFPLDQASIVFDCYLKNASKANYNQPDKLKVLEILNQNYSDVLNSNYFIDSLILKSKVDKEFSFENINTSDGENYIISPIERDQAFSIFKDWIIEEAEEIVLIVDPYFDKSAVDLLNLIYMTGKKLKIKVLACDYLDENILLEEWSKYTKEDLQECAFIFTSYRNSSDKPLHDRFILSKNSGLRLGTSVNSIGSSKKFAEISKLKKGDIETLINDQLEIFITGSQNEINGERLIRRTYSL